MALFGSKKTNKEIDGKANGKSAPSSKNKTVKKVDTLTDQKKTATKKSTEKSAEKSGVPAIVGAGVGFVDSSIIIRPHISEKSGIQSQNGVYTFVVTDDANKPTVAKAVKAMYKVSPVNVAIINLPRKKVFVRGKKGTVSGFKKAVVTLKKGDKIDFI